MDDADVDWLTVTVGASDVGKHLHATTTITGTSSCDTDTAVAVWHGSSCDTPNPWGSQDNAADSWTEGSTSQEDLLSTTIREAGTSWIQVYPGAYYDQANGTTYNLEITLE